MKILKEEKKMIMSSITNIKDRIHANICYQLFITPARLNLSKEYKDFAKTACEYLEANRSELINVNEPRHHVVHRFAQPNIINAPKVLIAHGWMSRAAYMVGLIKSLHKLGFDIYALDFPAHGQSKGIQLPWVDATDILRQTLNIHGPFYGAIGHSFGGSMILNTITLSNQLPAWKINNLPERVVLMSSPTNMRVPVERVAYKLRLTEQACLHLRDVFIKETNIDISQLDYRHYKNYSDIKFLCIHGRRDKSIPPSESIDFCNHYPNASLSLFSDADHISVLMDRNVVQTASNFLLS